MPEVHLQLQWPDGRCSTLYSPSTVILEYLKVGDQLSVAELKTVGSEALAAASERVRARYGFACTRTDEEAARLHAVIKGYDPEATVHVLAAGQPERASLGDAGCLSG
jgi:uncharacterized repeat protein (TIGR04042 family)